ncbi:hypothetical protein HmCmsJML021_01091 [Escherichia coli]|nr:hypothetical protein HmCmsJML021_01091 [Escherichia coli]
MILTQLFNFFRRQRIGRNSATASDNNLAVHK